MTTRLDILAGLRMTLPDAENLRDLSLLAWVNRGLADLSNHFPRQAAGSFNCAAGNRLYALGVVPSLSGLWHVLWVEYPAGDDPPRYLLPKSERSTLFRGGPYYDLRGDPPTHLVLGEEPAGGEQVVVEFIGAHPALEDDQALCTLPDELMEALHLYVLWQAAKALEFAEAAAPDETSMLLSMLGLNAGRLERSYTSLVRQLKGTYAPGGWAGPWELDERDRVY